MKILIIGEAYGNSENMFQTPFIGASGRELAKMLFDAGLASLPEAKYPSELDMIQHWKFLEKEYSIKLGNVFNEQPEDNNVELFFGPKNNDACLDFLPLKPGKYLLKQHRHHLDKLFKLVESEKPNIIIAVGGTPTWALTNQQKISEIRGTIFWNDKLKVKILPTYHPAAILRNWSLRTIGVADLIKANKESEFPEVRKIKRWILVDPTLEEIRDWIAKPAEIYSVDIETAYALYSKAEIAWMAKNAPNLLGMLSRQISMVGFARSKTDALVIPFMKREIGQNQPGRITNLNYWKSRSDEVKAWELTFEALEKPIPKLFQNGMFDIQRLLEVGARISMCREDTMLKHHSMLPELQKGLGFLGALYSNESSWKNMRSFGDSLKASE